VHTIERRELTHRQVPRDACCLRLCGWRRYRAACGVHTKHMSEEMEGSTRVRCVSSQAEQRAVVTTVHVHPVADCSVCRASCELSLHCNPCTHACASMVACTQRDEMQAGMLFGTSTVTSHRRMNVLRRRVRLQLLALHG
jgi:hypothetical protein